MTLCHPAFPYPRGNQPFAGPGTESARKIACAQRRRTARFDLAILQLNLTVQADGFVCSAAQGDTPNVTIRVKPVIPLILQNRERAFSYVTVEGDADFANTISQVGQSLQWEAEEDLSKLFGDIAAVKIVAGAKDALKTARAAGQSLTENIAEYLLEENPVLVRPQAVTDFGDKVAKFRDDVERLQKRLEKLEGRLP